MKKISFGRVNIPHVGHKELIESVDLFILSEGESKNKLPAKERLENLLYIYPHLRNKVKIGKITEYFKTLSNDPNIIVKCGEENIRFPKAYGFKKVEISQRIFSSSKIREICKLGSYMDLFSYYNNDLEKVERIISIFKREINR